MKLPIYDQSRKGIIFAQHIASTFTRIYLLLSRSEIVRRGDWIPEKGTRYIIASTHLSWFDPFVITTSLTYKQYLDLLPYRYLSTPKFLSNPVLRPFMIALGCYPSHPYRNYPYGLDASLKLLADNNTIVIFPQGKRTREQSHEAKRGVSELAKQQPARVIPILIQAKPSRFIPAYKIVVGIPFDGSTHTPQEIMEVIYKLDDETRGKLKP